jgi:hypothetical protein
MARTGVRYVSIRPVVAASVDEFQHRCIGRSLLGVTRSASPLYVLVRGVGVAQTTDHDGVVQLIIGAWSGTRCPLAGLMARGECVSTTAFLGHDRKRNRPVLVVRPPGTPSRRLDRSPSMPSRPPLASATWSISPLITRVAASMPRIRCRRNGSSFLLPGNLILHAGLGFGKLPPLYWRWCELLPL